MTTRTLAIIHNGYQEEAITATKTRKGDWAIRGGGYRFNRSHLVGIGLKFLRDARLVRIVEEETA